MIGFHPRRFTIALLAQIVFCLVAAPILAAERWAAPAEVCAAANAGEHREDSPRDSRPIIQAAFDASDVRPEEVSDAGQKRTRSRSKSGRASGIRPGSGLLQRAATADELIASVEPGAIAGQKSPGDQAGANDKPVLASHCVAFAPRAILPGIARVVSSTDPAPIAPGHLPSCPLSIARELRVAALEPILAGATIPARQKLGIRDTLPSVQSNAPPPV